MITAAEVRRLFDYDPSTGHLIKRVLGRRVGSETFKNGRPLCRRVSIHSTLKMNEAAVIWLWMTGSLPVGTIDHADLDPFNNKWGNLRDASFAEQNANQRHWGNSQFKWVHKVGNRYKARVTMHGRTHYLGYFDDPQEAHAAALKLANSIHGRFTRAT